MTQDAKKTAANESHPFVVRCCAGEAGEFRVGTEHLEILIGQRVRRAGMEEMWDSLGVYTSVEEDGTLIARVVVFNPDWEEPIEVVNVRSRPDDAACQTPLGCNLNHKSLKPILWLVTNKATRRANGPW